MLIGAGVGAGSGSCSNKTLGAGAGVGAGVGTGAGSCFSACRSFCRLSFLPRIRNAFLAAEVFAISENRITIARTQEKEK